MRGGSCAGPSAFTREPQGGREHRNAEATPIPLRVRNRRRGRGRLKTESSRPISGAKLEAPPPQLSAAWRPWSACGSTPLWLPAERACSSGAGAIGEQAAGLPPAEGEIPRRRSAEPRGLGMTPGGEGRRRSLPGRTALMGESDPARPASPIRRRRAASRMWTARAANATLQRRTQRCRKLRRFWRKVAHQEWGAKRRVAGRRERAGPEPGTRNLEPGTRTRRLRRRVSVRS